MQKGSKEIIKETNKENVKIEGKKFARGYSPKYGRKQQVTRQNAGKNSFYELWKKYDIRSKELEKGMQEKQAKQFASKLAKTKKVSR